MPGTRKPVWHGYEKHLRKIQKHFPSVESVVDATEPIDIDVRSADAKVTGRKNHRACAFAEACKRQFKLKGALFSASRAYLVRGTKATRYMVPDSISRELVSFDRGGRVAAGTYTLTPPTSKNVLGARPGSPWKSGPRNGGTPRKIHYTMDIRAKLNGQPS